MRPAVATIVVVAGGTLEMDGQRPVDAIHYGDGIQLPTCQMRTTDNEGNVVELALSKIDVRNIMDVMELYS